MATVKRLEGSTQGFGGLELFYQVWRGDRAEALIFITHGIGEHSECYNDLGKELAESGYLAVAWDLRGHGKSEGKRGYVADFNDYVSDYVPVLGAVRTKLNAMSIPTIAFGHSMGGLITIKFLLTAEAKGIRAAVLSAPALGVSLPVPAIKDYAARVASEWLPKLTLNNEIDYADLHSDREKLKMYAADPLRHDKVSPRLYLGMVSGFAEAKENANQITMPILLQLAGKEKIVSNKDSHEFYEKLGSKNKEIHTYSDSLHEIYVDLQKAEVIRDLKKFLAGVK